MISKNVLTVSLSSSNNFSSSLNNYLFNALSYSSISNTTYFLISVFFNFLNYSDNPIIRCLNFDDISFFECTLLIL